MNIFYIFYIKKNIINWNKIIAIMLLINFITYIIVFSLFTNLRKYGMFIPVIILEFIMYNIFIFIVVSLIILSYFDIYKLFNNNNIIINSPQIRVDINIPQLAVYIDNNEFTDINIPHATPIIFNNLCNITEL
jgi:hypothetical protein